MPLNYANLDDQTRSLMRSEIEVDVGAGTLYKGTRLTEQAAEEWEGLLKQAVASGNDETLAQQLNAGGRLKQFEQRKKPNGGFTTAKVPVTAAETLAEGEFNRFYIRALCLRAIEQGVQKLIVYRAKDVTSPRRESEEKIGTGLDPQQLLADLRAHPGVDTALGLPPGPNSGLSVRLPQH